MPLLRLATWNCQHGHPDPGRLAKAAASLDVDVLALQEVDRGSRRVDGRDLAAEVHDAFGGEAVWARALALRGGGEYGHLLLVRGSVQGKVHGLRRDRRGEPRRVILAEVEVGGRTWSLAATHLATRRTAATMQLADVLDLLGRRPVPRILMGDLNLPPTQLLPWLSPEGYRLALGQRTFPARRPRIAIDHVAVAGRGCSVAATETRTLPVGDHRALVAEVRCPG
jgi:endonuclease/exonuclease/phosphatase family metal-dependent hydrolase